MSAAAALIGFVILERLAELALAARNQRRLIARGAVEIGAGHYPLIVATHVLFLAALAWLGYDQPVQPVWLAVFALLQVARVWTMATLGERWTTRILVLPGAPLVTAGPYRFIRHPNYAIVIGEIAVLPLALGLPWLALIFSLLNAAVLVIRIRSENAALAQ